MKPYDNVNVSSIKCIGHYHNSSRGHHGTRLQLGPFYFKTIYFWSCFLGSIYDWSSVLPKELLQFFIQYSTKNVFSHAPKYFLT